MSISPKESGGMQPLGVASVEDKIVQRALVEVLNAIYEVDFRSFSCGFRPGRSQHQALDALAAEGSNMDESRPDTGPGCGEVL